MIIEIEVLCGKCGNKLIHEETLRNFGINLHVSPCKVCLGVEEQRNKKISGQLGGQLGDQLVDQLWDQPL